MIESKITPLIACEDSPWQNGLKVLMITGNCDIGVLYAVQSLGKYLSINISPKSLISLDGRPDLRKSFDSLLNFINRGFHTFENRGIWTCGYVILDYHRFIDNMVRLRMNTLIIWNDIPPLNSPEIIDFAHSRGISIIFGFHWGWGLPDLQLQNPEDRRKIKNSVLNNYTKNYQR